MIIEDYIHLFRMNTQLNWDLFESKIAYDRLYYVFNVLLTRLLEHQVIDLFKITTKDPRIFELSGIVGGVSILLSVKRVRNRNRMILDNEPPEDDPIFRYALDDSIIARLVMFDTNDNFFRRNYLFERDYQLPEDFEQIVFDILSLIV